MIGGTSGGNLTHTKGSLVIYLVTLLLGSHKYIQSIVTASTDQVECSSVSRQVSEITEWVRVSPCHSKDLIV